MKNINVFVYNDSKLVYDKKWKMDYSVEGIYEFMGGNKDMIDLLGEGVEVEWDVKKYVSKKGDVWSIRFKLDDSDFMMRFVDRSVKI